MPDPTHFLVTTRDRNYRQTRRVACRDLPTAYTVAMQWRKRTNANGCESLPLWSTDVSITAMTGPVGSGSVVACLTWPGGVNRADVVAKGKAATWRWVDPTATHRGACLLAPPAGLSGFRPARWELAR